MSEQLITLVDCNSFFCSCERVFNPDLQNRPVIVLSNNDGCAVARTKEAKALGIKMGAPYFKIKDLVKKHDVAVFSSNFTLYGDMSKRVMETLRSFSPEMEIYSIDEAFLSFNGMSYLDLKEYGKLIKKTVHQYTGIPVSVGIAPTKVLAKAANYLAKIYDGLEGVLELTDPVIIDKALKKIPVGELWGIGRKSTAKLNTLNIYTAFDLKNASPQFIKRTLHLPGERIVKELNGISCIDLETDDVSRKQILSSRSFGRPVKTLEELQQSISMHTTRVTEKLRRQQSVCNKINVFVQTNPHKNEPQYYNSKTIELVSPTDSTQLLLKKALKALREVYKKGYAFKKCGVFISELTEKNEQQLNLFDQAEGLDQQDKLMSTIDKINSINGRDTIKYASCGLEQKWSMRCEMRSKAFTTRWSDLLEVS